MNGRAKMKVTKLKVIPLVLAGFFSIIAVLMLSSHIKDVTIVEAVPLTDAITLEDNQHSVYELTGYVDSIYFSDTNIMYLEIKTETKESFSVITFPGMGMLKDDYYLGDKVKVTGTIKKYQGNFQIQPLSQENIILLKRGEGLNPKDFVPLDNLKRHIEKTVLTGPLEIVDMEPFVSSNGKHHLRVNLLQNGISQEAIIFAGSWTEDTIELMQSDTHFILKASVSEFRGTPSLAIEAFIPYAKAKSIASDKTEAKPEIVVESIPLNEVSEHKGKDIVIDSVTFKNVEIFVSEAGKEHLRFEIVQGKSSYNGIMFDGSWTEKERSLMLSNKPQRVTASIDVFRDQISVVINEIGD